MKMRQGHGRHTRTSEHETTEAAPTLVAVRLDSEAYGPLRVHVPQDSTADQVRSALDARAADIAHRGPLIAAYLSLPDVDATQHNAAELAGKFFVGDFGSMDAILSELTEYEYWRAELDEFARTRGLVGLVMLDERAICEVVALTWDVVQMGGRLYVFDK